MVWLTGVDFMGEEFETQVAFAQRLGFQSFKLTPKVGSLLTMPVQKMDG